MKDWLVKASLVCIALLAPIHSMIIATGILIFVDFFLGVWAAKKRGEAITSAGFRRTVSKMVIYQIAIITGFICETYLIGGIFPISKLVAGAIGFVEITSILENANAIHGEHVFKKLLEKIGSENNKKQ